jgi:hypothetical protein
LAAQLPLAFSRNSTVLPNAVISGTRSYLRDVLRASLRHQVRRIIVLSGLASSIDPNWAA